MLGMLLQFSWLCLAVSAAHIRRAGVDAATRRRLVYMLVAMLLHYRSASLCSVHMEGWCECRYIVVNAYCVGSYALAFLIFLALFSSLGCAYMRGRLIEQSRLLAHVIENGSIFLTHFQSHDLRNSIAECGCR